MKAIQIFHLFFVQPKMNDDEPSRPSMCVRFIRRVNYSCSINTSEMRLIRASSTLSSSPTQNWPLGPRQRKPDWHCVHITILLSTIIHATKTPKHQKLTSQIMGWKDITIWKSSYFCPIFLLYHSSRPHLSPGVWEVQFSGFLPKQRLCNDQNYSFGQLYDAFLGYFVQLIQLYF